MKRLRSVVDDFEEIVLVALLRRLAAARQLDPHARRNMLHRFGKREALRQRQKFKNVAASAAAEAVKKAFVAIDMKRRRLLAMKWTETLVALAREKTPSFHVD